MATNPARLLELVRARGHEQHRDFYEMIQQMARDGVDNLRSEMDADLEPETPKRYAQRLQLHFFQQLASDDFMKSAERHFQGQIEAAKQRGEEEMKQRRAASRKLTRKDGEDEGEEAEGE